MKSLSIRQQRFITVYAQIGNATEAVARAGYRGTRASLAVQGCRLKRTLRFAKECSEIGLFRSPEDLKEAISEHLWASSRATPEKYTGKDILKALELLCKLHGLFDPLERVTNVQMNYFNVKDANPQELWQRLQEIKVQKVELLEEIANEASSNDESAFSADSRFSPQENQTGNIEQTSEIQPPIDNPTDQQ